jgi:hypothetical protein
MEFIDLLAPYNPWWNDRAGAFKTLPDFERPIIELIYQRATENDGE